MGQCSTLPANDDMNEQLNGTTNTTGKRGGNNTGQEKLDFNGILSPDDPKSTHKMYKTIQPQITPSQQRREQQPEPMQIEETFVRELPPPTLPAGAVRTRCYKLNLDSEINYGSTPRHIFLGPFEDPAPYLTCTESDDSDDANPTEVAIRTAQIFRGITVDRNGTILTQNARATRSNRGNNKMKRGEKSRQAAKIDKAKDLVEEAIINSGTDEDSAKLVSLFIVGEYDDMKHLVRDGSRKIRESDGLPDEALLRINRPRSNKAPTSSTTRTPTSTRSTTSTTTRGRRSMIAGNTPSSNTIAPSPKPLSPVQQRQQQQQQQQQEMATTSTSNKLKNSRDNGNSSRNSNNGAGEMRFDACNDFIKRGGGGDHDNEWHAPWTLWNCGGTGTVSPLQPSSPNRINNTEGRNDSVSQRENAVTSRAG